MLLIKYNFGKYSNQDLEAVKEAEGEDGLDYIDGTEAQVRHFIAL
jgi:hypothetical protein